MKASKQVEELLGQVVRRSWDAVEVVAPPVEAIRARAHAVRADVVSLRTLQRRRLSAIAVLACAALLVAAFVAPRLAKAVTAAADVIRFRVVLLLPQGKERHLWLQTTSLRDARHTSRFQFIEPAGLPDESRLISVMRMPAQTGGRISIAYQASGGLAFTINEERADMNAGTRKMCFSLQSSSSALAQLSIATNSRTWQSQAEHGRHFSAPPGMRMIPCPVDATIGTTRVFVTSNHGRMNGAQAAKLLRAMRR